MLSTEAVEKAIELLDGGANESAVAEATGISHEEAKAVANALYVGETGRLLREVALAGVLEAAAQALRSGRGLVGDTAGDVVREIWNCYPSAGLKFGRINQPSSSATVDGGETGTRELLLAGLANTRHDGGLYIDWEIELLERSEHEREVKINEQSCQNHSQKNRAESVNRLVRRPNDSLFSSPVGFSHGVFPARFRRRTARRPRARRGACWF